MMMNYMTTYYEMVLAWLTAVRKSHLHKEDAPCAPVSGKRKNMPEKKRKLTKLGCFNLNEWLMEPLYQ